MHMFHRLEIIFNAIAFVVDYQAQLTLQGDLRTKVTGVLRTVTALLVGYADVRLLWQAQGLS
jgi:hypothetical protein